MDFKEYFFINELRNNLNHFLFIDVGPGSLHAPHEVAFAIRSWPLLLQLSVFLSLYVFCFWPTSGKLPRLKICFPQYFGITRRCIQLFFYIYHFNFFFLHISSTYAKIWGETKFQHREFLWSGSKAKDVEREREREEERKSKSVITMVSIWRLNQCVTWPVKWHVT